ncbi:MAG: LysE family transporter [Pseudomonadota bacterium]
MIQLFLLGFLSGLLLAAPFGPAGALALRQTLYWGFRGGMACGLGAALADSIIGGVVGLGIGVVTTWLDDHVRELEVVAGVVLIAVGVAAVLELGAKPRPKRGVVRRASQSRLATSTGQAFLVTIGNPAVAGAFAALFTALGLADRIDALAWHQAWIALTAGIFAGAPLCWAGFVWMVSHVSGRVADVWLKRVHRGAGVVLVVVGIGVRTTAVL